MQYYIKNNNTMNHLHNKQEAQGLGALLDKMEDNDHINWITQRSRLSFTLKPAVFETQSF